MTTRQAVFLVNLLQDVNVLRPLIFMAVRELHSPVLILVTIAFRKRDKSGVWQRELAEIVAETGADISFFENDHEALHHLSGKTGVLVAASESHLSAHKPIHDLFLLAPRGFLRVTLQHGFECVGFLQSQDQNLAHGRHITFGADLVCGWCEADRLNSLVHSQRHKLVVAGPTSVIQPRSGEQVGGTQEMGLVCENMHSPRLNVAGDFKSDFLDLFGDFCQALQSKGRKVALRPHPGGQYVIKNKVALAANVELQNEPIYKVDLARYAYGISAPSSILVDMILAGIPVAVWQDADSVMDLGNYEGLTRISSLDEWLAFCEAAITRPEPFLEAQARFLERQKLLTRPEDVHARYAAVLGAALHADQPRRPPTAKVERVMFVANAYVPTLQLSFIKPLAPLVDSGRMITDLVTEEQLNKAFGKKKGGEAALAWLRQRFVDFRPSLVVFCRYSGPHTAWMLELAQEMDCPVVYHIDDDLLHIPEDIGLKKHQHHNHPERLAAVRHLLDHATLVYCSTSPLRERLKALSVATPVVAGDIYCSGNAMVPPESRPVRKIGYMASADHAHNFSIVLGAVRRLLHAHPDVGFEFFGSIPVPPELEEFGERIGHAPRIENYEEFLQNFAKYGWDIGICPLAPIHFNLMKANTKWVEYSSVGIAVIASKGTVYDECCSDGSGILAETEDDWFRAMEALVKDPEGRFQQVSRAQQKLARQYSVGRLREQVLAIFSKARQLHHSARLSEVEGDVVGAVDG
ncbi:MAG TPA: glycosyltransferase [Thiobacillaceae bacterium]|nr:glycosyltransferase [Thiobacillaceae bacterium]